MAKRTNRGMWGLAVALAVAVPVGSGDRSAYRQQPLSPVSTTSKPSQQELLERVDALSPWSAAYEKREAWDRLIAAAGLVQQMYREDVTAALDQFLTAVHKDSQDSLLERETKLYLLLRIVFDLPERSAYEFPAFGGV